MSKTRALNATRMKEYNYQRFFRKLRFQPMTRAQLARQLELTRAAATFIADRLIAAGMIKEVNSDVLSRQSTKALSWNAAYAHIAGFSINRGYISVGFSDFCGNVLRTENIFLAEFDSADVAVDAAARRLEKMLAQYSPAGCFLGVGVSSPGPLDTQSGVILTPPNFKMFHNFHVVEVLRERFKARVVLENDTNALALAEKCCGELQEDDRFLELLVDIGIGAALILDGSLINGPSGNGNGFGHTSIDINGPKCACGNRGCIEGFASIPNIVKKARELNPRFNNWESIIDQAYAGDEKALEIVRTEAVYLATLVVNASNVFNIQSVVFSGDHILYKSAMIFNEIKRELMNRVPSTGNRSVAILASSLPSNPTEANVLASINLVIEAFLDTSILDGNKF